MMPFDKVSDVEVSQKRREIMEAFCQNCPLIDICCDPCTSLQEHLEEEEN